MNVSDLLLTSHSMRQADAALVSRGDSDLHDRVELNGSFNIAKVLEGLGLVPPSNDVTRRKPL